MVTEYETDSGVDLFDEIICSCETKEDALNTLSVISQNIQILPSLSDEQEEKLFEVFFWVSTEDEDFEEYSFIEVTDDKEEAIKTFNLSLEAAKRNLQKM